MSSVRVKSQGTSIIILADGCRFFMKKEEAQKLRDQLNDEIQNVIAEEVKEINR